MSKIYAGTRTPDGCRVTVDGTPLRPRPDLMSLSGEGALSDSSAFEWGYDGAGPSHLALAILADLSGNDKRALNDFKTLRSGLISGLENDSWTLSGKEIELALEGIVEVPMTLAELMNKVRGKA